MTASHERPIPIDRYVTRGRVIMLGKICIRPVVTVSAQNTVGHAARAMRARNVGALVVVNAGRPIGMLTDRDIAVEVVAMGMDPDSTRVGDVMRKKPVTIQEDRGILDAARTFARTGVRRLPVVSAKGVLVGVIAVDDLFILLGNELGHMAGALSAGLRKAS
jgi:CBS domain-containing protein